MNLTMETELKGPAVPFFVRPITRAVATKIEDSFLNPNFESNFNFLENQLATSPDNGKFLAGPKLTGAVMISAQSILHSFLIYYLGYNDDLSPRSRGKPCRYDQRKISQAQRVSRDAS